MGFDINVSRFEGGVAAAIDQPTLQAFLARAGAVLDLRATYLVDFADGGALLLTASCLKASSIQGWPPTALHCTRCWQARSPSGTATVIAC
ncbi:MAG TPA: hypothetical protein PLF40_01245 [Kofleriaceae bacterium]|nr:hypothetical protein [Kofleriaceae bacterium]